MPVRVYSLIDVLKQLNQDSTQYLAPNQNEIVSQFMQGQETLKIQETATFNDWTPYPWLVANADGPTGFWLLGDPVSSTSVFDSNPYGPKAPGTVTGSVTFGATGPISGIKAATFSGSGQYIDVSGNPASLQSTSGTLECWVKTTQNPGVGGFAGLLAKQSAYGLFLYDTTGHLAAYDWGAASVRDSGVSINDGSWHHVALTYQSGVTNGSQLYKDGIAAGSAFTMTISAQTSDMGIACGAIGSQLLNGALFGAAFYPVTLSPTAIANHYAWGTASNTNGAYTYNFGSPTKRGWFTYPKPPVRGSNRWGYAIWGSFQWG